MILFNFLCRTFSALNDAFRDYRRGSARSRDCMPGSRQTHTSQDYNRYPKRYHSYSSLSFVILFSFWYLWCNRFVYLLTFLYSIYLFEPGDRGPLNHILVKCGFGVSPAYNLGNGQSLSEFLKKHLNTATRKLKWIFSANFSFFFFLIYIYYAQIANWRTLHDDSLFRHPP